MWFLLGGDLTLVKIKTLLKEEGFHANRAEDLGEYLGIKPGRIAALKQISGGDPDRLLSSVITEWLDNDIKKSWKKLATALRHCHHSLIANKIAPQEGMHEFAIIESVRYTLFPHHDKDSCINIGSPFYINSCQYSGTPLFQPPEMRTPLYTVELPIPTP